jgi:hypothetical protein
MPPLVVRMPPLVVRMPPLVMPPLVVRMVAYQGPSFRRHAHHSILLSRPDSEQHVVQLYSLCPCTDYQKKTIKKSGFVFIQNGT